jgi:superfamily II DNA or RNA helicase
MIPAITADLLHEAIQSEGMIRSGLAYFQQGRVGEIEVDHDLDMVTAIVRGSGRNQYFTSVVFEEGPSGGIADSECSCPVGYGCKHAAALLYAVREAVPAVPPTGQRLRIAAATGEPPKLSGAIGDWLDGLAIESLVARIEPEPVCFVIEPVRAFKQAKRTKGARLAPEDEQARYVLHIRAWRRGGYGGGWQVFHQYQLQHSPVHIDPPALRLLARMSQVAIGGDFDADRAPTGRHGWQWLCEAAQAGLLRWKSAEGPLVGIAPANLETRLVWRILGDGRQMLTLAETDDDLTIFAGDPPVFFDCRRHELGLIDAGVAPPLAGRLLAMPPIGPAEIPALAARWVDIAGDVVSMPRLAELAEFASVTPRPVLQFMTDKAECLEQSWGWHRARFRSVPIELARLEFDYAGHRVRSPAPTSEVIVRGPEGLMRFSRDLDAEQAAVDRLTQTPLVPIALHDDFKPKPHQAWDHAVVDADVGGVSTDGYPELLINDVATLQGEGWLIEYAADWRHGFLPLDSAGARLAVTESGSAGAKTAAGGIDWFDVELAALVDGKRIDILPALRRLLVDGGQQVLERDDDYRLPLMLGGGRFTAIRLGLVRPLIEALLRLALADRGASTLRLNRYDLGTVHEISASGLSWTDEGALRQLADALHAPDRASYASPSGLVAQLRPYQEIGVAWLQALHGAALGGILADDMGLGKTLQAIAHILHVRQGADAMACKPVLIVAPTSVLPNWQAELARFAPGLDCLLWHGAERQGRAENLRQAKIVLTSYPLLARDKDVLAGHDYELVVLDEAHVLKNPKTVGFKAAAALKARQTIALSGTPIENRLNDIWALASLTNPGLLGSFEAFRKDYRTPIEKQGDRTALAALARRLRPFMLRRTKDEIAADLPPKTLVPERIELSDAQTRLYESQRLLMHARVREEIDRVGLMRSQIIVLDAMLKLRQICCDPSLLPCGLGDGVASAKRSRLLEMLPELLGEGRRVIVFSQFTSMLDRIATDLAVAGIDHEQLRGTTRDRARPVRRFQQGEVPLILISLKAGGAGVNLTAADTVILYDPWWNPAVEAQAIDRAHRIGQTKPVFVHRLIATGTIEEKILALQERKQGLADMLWSEQARAGGPGLDDDDIAFLLG